MYSFYFDGMLLPITPEKLTVKIKGNNKTLTLVNEGDINFLRSPGLTEISFDAVLPTLGKYAFASSFCAPSTYLDLFERLITERKPFRFIVSRVAPSGKLLFETNMKVSLENYTLTEDAAKGPDITCAIALKQYVSYATKTVKVIAPAQPENNPTITEEKSREASSVPTANPYTVVTGDCLWNIAKRYYGNGAQYTKIVAANPVFKERSPNLIYPGDVLVIP